MFPWHDKTRRRVALVAFALLGVVPTVALLAYGIVRNLPVSTEREAARLSTLLGLDVSLDRCHHPRPGVVLYEGLQLADPETGQVLVECDRLEGRRQDGTDPNRHGRQEIVLTASHASIHGEGSDVLRERLDPGMRSEKRWNENDVRLAVALLTVSNDQQRFDFEAVEAGLYHAESKTIAQLSFRPAGAEHSGKVRLGLTRNRRVDPPQNELALDTGTHALPCGLLEPAVPSFKSLGPACRFRGRLLARQAEEGWQGDLSGWFLDVDLQRCLADRFGHRLSGKAELAIEKARFRDGRLEEAVAMVGAGPGEIGRPLVDAASLWFAMVPGPGFTAGEDPVAYERMTLIFTLDASGLRIEGKCPPEGEGVVAMGRGGALLSVPGGHEVPSATVAAVLALPGEFQLPATLRTAWLTGLLPSPEPEAQDESR